MDLGAFYVAYRADGHGRPALMVALLLYAYSRGNRSSRGIERACVEDVAYRVIAANLVPDHSTVAEFRKRHETALAEVFGEVLSLCEEAGLVKVGVITVDGTKVSANASNHASRDYRQIAQEILAEADRIDREEDELYGEKRGDELPEELQTAAGRRAALREAKQRLERREASGSDEQPDREGEPGAETEPDSGLALEFDRDTVLRASGRGRRRWFLEARHQLDEHRAVQAVPITRSRQARLLEIERRFSEQLAVEIEANQAYEAYIAGGVDHGGQTVQRAPESVRPAGGARGEDQRHRS